MLSCLGLSRISIKELNEYKIIHLGFPKEGHVLGKKEKVTIGVMDILHFPPPSIISKNLLSK